MSEPIREQDAPVKLTETYILEGNGEVDDYKVTGFLGCMRGSCGVFHDCSNAACEQIDMIVTKGSIEIRNSGCDADSTLATRTCANQQVTEKTSYSINSKGQLSMVVVAPLQPDINYQCLYNKVSNQNAVLDGNEGRVLHNAFRLDDIVIRK